MNLHDRTLARSLEAPVATAARGHAESAGGLAAPDWELLLDAMTARLRHSSADSSDSGFRDVVLDCVQALQQLQEASANERSWRIRLERDLSAAHAALAAGRAHLAGIEAGERHARHLAAHDGLTALPNGGSFKAGLDRALARDGGPPPPLSVLFIDLDAFKPVNDSHGHDTGDDVLRIVAQRLSGAARPGDLVCRLHGDEFACLVVGALERPQIINVAARLHAAVSAPMRRGTLELVVRPSIGIAMCPADGDTTAALLRCADGAMYLAKRQQCGWAFCDDSTAARTPVQDPRAGVQAGTARAGSFITMRVPAPGIEPTHRLPCADSARKRMPTRP